MSPTPAVDERETPGEVLLLVIPTLGRRPELLRRAVASIHAQHVAGLAVDLVLVAPRGTLGAGALPAGTRLVDDPGAGMSGALNAGLAARRPGTTWFAWLGDDDLLRPDALDAAVSLLRADPRAVLAYGWCDYIDAHDEVVFRSGAGALARWILRFGPNLIPQPGSVMRLRSVVDVGGLDESLGLAMDLDLFLRLRRVGHLVSVSRTLAAFRWHDDSTTVANGLASMEEADRVRMRYMSRPTAAVYRCLRWPGRWALGLAKTRVHRRARNRAVVYSR